jgi:oxygen-independent coproporphyrinogen III oxidase
MGCVNVIGTEKIGQAINESPNCFKSRSNDMPSALYVHIPFCLSRCSYCDFASSSGQDDLLPAYVRSLCQEIASLPAGQPLRSIYFGGGTPSLLSILQVDTILEAISARLGFADGVEISVEANPGTVSLQHFKGLRSCGVNRLSIGVQSMDNGELHMLGRIHSALEAVQAVRDARVARFINLGMDLIYGLPKQTVNQWKDSLESVLVLQPDHLSLYALTLEKGTSMYNQIAEGHLPLPDEDLVAEMYSASEGLLAGLGWDHYELSNWARTPEFRCRHNLEYWHNGTFIGVGAAAHSYWQGQRYWNFPEPGKYIEAMAAGLSPVAGMETIDRPTELAETAIMGLRLTEGLGADEFQARFRLNLQAVFQEAIDESVAAGLLTSFENRLCLTPRGRLLGNDVFWRFLRDARTGREA